MSHPYTSTSPDITTFSISERPQKETATKTILVATDGTPAGLLACRVASKLAQKTSARVSVTVVVEPLPILVPEPAIATHPLVTSPELMHAVRDRVRSNIRDIAPDAAGWEVDVEYGRPSAEIARKAREAKADLIVMGLVHHGVMDRVLDGDTALEVVRSSKVPVLLAADDWQALPRCAVFAVDFSAQSMTAARAGLRLLDKGATVILAHVRPTPTIYDGVGAWEYDYETAAEKELSRFADVLNAPADIHVEQELLRGRPAGALLTLAQKKGADLMVAGTRGAGLIERMLLGSVATSLMHHSTKSLLVVPELRDEK